MPLTTYTAGDVLTASSLNANLSFAASSPSSGLTFISATTFTAVASVSLPANTFSATFGNYLVLVNVLSASTNISLSGRFRVGGVDESAGNYSNMVQIVDSVGGSTTNSNSSQTSVNLLNATSTGTFAAALTFMSPNLSELSSILAQIFSVNPGVASRGASGAVSYSLDTVFDSFSVIANTGTITGTVRAYGYANS